MITSDTKLTNQILTARSKRRSTHVPNLTDELGTAEERRLNNFGRQIRFGAANNDKFGRVCRIMRVAADSYGVPVMCRT